MAILVLGGAGYIGSHTVYELIDAGRDVVVADNLLTGFRAAVHPKARFYQLDIRDRGALDTLFQAEKIEGESMVPEKSLTFVYLTAAKVTGLPFDLFKTLSAKDAARLRYQIGSFFLSED